jgi:hypothetical protein
MATPVTTVSARGLPIVVASNGLPVSEAAAGIAVTIASNGRGLPVTFVGGGPAPGAPVNTVAPVVTGTTAAGQTLTTTNGTWTGAAPITYTYQWYEIAPAAAEGFNLLLANGVDDLLLANGTDKLLLAEQLRAVNATDVSIPGATASTYVIPAGKTGFFYYCKVTATNVNGSATATSNIVGPVT